MNEIILTKATTLHKHIIPAYVEWLGKEGHDVVADLELIERVQLNLDAIDVLDGVQPIDWDGIGLDVNFDDWRERLEDRLAAAAPKGYWFGCLDGGSSTEIGFWPHDEFPQEAW